MSSTRSRRTPGARLRATSRSLGRASGRCSASGAGDTAPGGKRAAGARRPSVEGPALSARATPSSGSVFADLGFPPEEAENLHVRAELVAALRGVIAERGLTACRALVRSPRRRPVREHNVHVKAHYRAQRAL
jgi:hypothetical protein